MEWHKLENRTQQLLIELAREQKFQCYFCSRRTGLVFDHEHHPGVRSKQTIYNIRGLLCQTCNSHISYLEQENLRGYKNFENAESRISPTAFEEYKYQFELRVLALGETELERELGQLRYSRRRLFLGMIEDWKEFKGRRQSHYFRWAKLKRRLRPIS
ncbi:endonuclease domain-containing protein [Bradyrhizobium erythrophlei]|uniref:endonuclease domain-containing protein n=1 Tax=Bradyrhizobium erythrophlei TaxID=1437360 RepID=UPI0035E4BEAD